MSFTDSPPANLHHVYDYRVCGQNNAGSTCSTTVQVGTMFAPHLALGF